MPSSLRETRYQELFDRYRDQISSGQLAPGARLPSFPELRTQGYGQATIEKALRMLEAEGLVERNNGRGVFVTAPRSRPAQTGLVGLLGLRDGSGLHPYWSELLVGAQDALHGQGYDIALIKDLEQTRWERLEGVLTFGYEGLQWARRRPLTMPLVALMAVEASVPYLEVDEFSAMQAAVAHLVRLGHRKIAYLVVAGGELPRLPGYCAGLAAANIPVQPAWIRRFEAGGPTSSVAFTNTARAAMEDWLAQDWTSLGCTALIVWNDDAALGAMRALRQAGYRIPEDVSVVGFDGSPVAALCEPALTTLNVPLRHMGQRGAECLLRLMEGLRVESGKQVFQASLHCGASTTAPTGAKAVPRHSLTEIMEDSPSLHTLLNPEIS